MDKVYNIILVWLNYHTRIMKRFIVAILSVFLMVSCSDSKYDFDSKGQANVSMNVTEEVVTNYVSILKQYEYIKFHL